MAATVSRVTPASRKLVRHAFVPALALLSSTLMVAVVWRSQALVDSRPDPYWFSAMAESLLRGEGFAPFGSMLHRRTPGYPFFLAGLYALFGVHLLVVQVAQILLFVGTCWLTGDVAGRVFSSARVGLLAGAACALHPSLLRYVPDLHLETLLTFVFMLSVWLSVRFYQSPSVPAAVGLGFTWGLATLVKSVVMLYPPLFALLCWLGWRKRGISSSGKARLVALAVALVSMVLTISPWTARNYVVTGHFVPTTTGVGDAILRSFVFSRTEFITLQRPPYTDAENESNAMFRALCAAQGAVWEADDLQTERILAAEAKRRIAADPLAFVKKTFVGLFTFWYQMTSLKNSLLAGAFALVGWLLAAVGLPRAAREGHPAWLVLAPIVYLNAFLALLLSLGRYSVPVWPCLLALAAFGFDTLMRRLWPRSLGAA